jgi:hypothetical protein
LTEIFRINDLREFSRQDIRNEDSCGLHLCNQQLTSASELRKTKIPRLASLARDDNSPKATGKTRRSIFPNWNGQKQRIYLIWDQGFAMRFAESKFPQAAKTATRE